MVAGQAGVRLGALEGAGGGEGEVSRGAADQGGFVPVLQVGADAGEGDEERDAVRGEFGGRADAAEFEQLGGVEGAGGEDHFAGGGDGARNAGGRAGGARVSVVEAFAGEEVDAGGLGGGAAGVEADFGHERVEADVQGVFPGAVRVNGVGGIHDEVSRAGALDGGVPNRQRDLVEVLLLVSVRGVGVDVLRKDFPEAYHRGNDYSHQGLTHRCSRAYHQGEQLLVLNDEIQVCQARLEPPAEAVTDNTIGEISISLKTFEILPHVFWRPRRISRDGCDIRPIALMRVDGDHGIMPCTSAQRSRSGIKNSQRCGAGRRGGTFPG